MIRRLLVHEYVLAVCRYRDDGSLSEGYGLMETVDLERLARFARDYHHMLMANANQLSMFSEMPGWTPTRGWMVFGDTHTVIGYGNLACVVDSRNPPLDELLESLEELAEL